MFKFSDEAKTTMLDTPNVPGTWIVVICKDEAVEGCFVQSVVSLGEDLYVRTYMNPNKASVFMYSPKPVDKFNKPEYKWILLSEDLSGYLKNFLL